MKFVNIDHNLLTELKTAQKTAQKKNFEVAQLNCAMVCNIQL